MVWRHLFRLSRRSKALHDLPSRLVSPKLRRALHLSGRAEQGQATATIGTSSGSIYGAGFGGLGLGLGLGLGVGVGTNSLVSDKEAGPLDEHFISRAAEKAQPAVVNLTFKSKGYMGLRQVQSGGSGFIIGWENGTGTILTNAHVVEGRGRKKKKDGELQVTLRDGTTLDAEVVNTDPLSDLAIVKVKCEEELPTVKLGDSSHIRVGEWVVALGSPLSLQNTVTSGIISCVERKRSELGIFGSGSRTDYIQTDAAINAGNSGGPLVNLKGEVIGINSIKALAADGVSFAIPIETAKFVIKQVLKYGRVVRPYIGIKMLELSKKTAEMLRKDNPAFPKIDSGIFVPQVAPGGPAEECGFRHGDVIISFDGKSVTRGEEIIELLGSEVGKRHQVVVVRDHGEKKVLYVTSEEAVS